MPKKTKNKYNHYTEDFRREAVRRSDDPNTSAAEVAKELGIHPGHLTKTPIVKTKPGLSGQKQLDLSFQGNYATPTVSMET